MRAAISGSDSVPVTNAQTEGERSLAQRKAKALFPERAPPMSNVLMGDRTSALVYMLLAQTPPRVPRE